jgi:hypothetical protein
MVVPDLEVAALFTEQQGFTNFAYQLPGSNLSLKASSEADNVNFTNAWIYFPHIY